MTAKTLPELTAYIESRIRAFGRDNGIDEWSSCIEMYACMVGEKAEFVGQVIKAEKRPTEAIMRSLVGHMGITCAYELDPRVIACDKGYEHEEYYYVIRTRG